MPDTGRLPRTVAPTRYDLDLTVDLVDQRFEGEVVITLDVGERTRNVALHALDLAVELLELAQNGRTIAAELTLDPGVELLRIAAAADLEPGPARLRLAFRAPLSAGLVGFYRSRYTGDDGAEHILAATQFEAPHARRAFPCFDEPEFKAVFSIALTVDDTLLALSNGPEIGREPAGPGRVRVRFGDTVPMSTYLVAAIVGPLDITDPVDADGIPVRVAHVPGRAHLTRYALDVAAFSLRFFRDYYGVDYPGEKLDLVALPDFAFGAMENLGCVTFRETSLLVDEATVTHGDATNVALTIVHEIAHMWFGDLVTMKWWNGIWLNEAFATFMEHAGVDSFRPEWRTWDDFAIGRSAAKEVDALENTRPVEYEVHSPSDADGMFDLLTYQKGGSVVRMLEQWTGPDAFRAGVRGYLERYQFANTETTDLWDALEAATGRPARRIMDSWIFQPGFPEIIAERGNGSVRLRQRRFTYDGRPSPEVWSIPLLVRVGDHTESVLLDETEMTIPVDGDAPVVVHGGGEGFYRVSYPPEWRTELVESGACTPLERYALVDDAWAAVLAGSTTAAEFVDFTRRFAGETDLVVWRALVARLRDASRLVEGDALTALRAVIAGLARPAFERLGWEPAATDGPRERQLRGILVEALGTVVRAPDVVERARHDHADPDVAAAALAVVADSGTEAEFDAYVERSQDAPTPQEKVRYLYSLPQFPTEALVLRACALAVSDAVRSQSAPFVVQRALKHRTHGRLAFEFMSDHWDEMNARFPRTLIPRIFDGVSWLVDDDSVRAVPEFVAAHPIAEGERIIAQHLEKQRVHRATVERERTRFSDFLLG